MKLESVPQIGSKQAIFETLCVGTFNLSLGCMAIRADSSGYCNEHVQWFYEQFCK